ncbi:RDD family protein [Aliishimia ponticola]|uniref:RDD family protein n=1 Tax=Aliishimia ponticola TaxID=2499833 RepID=A0A4S4NSK1_9RHOB|nr:RDD family protein [Aliishimia ponticola]THH39220.1 RDD family protein [Aliishimia ponticola]
MSDYTSQLPDPITQPEFYDSVPAKRFLAWVIDTLLILTLVLVSLPFTAFLAVFFIPTMFFLLGFAYRVVTLANGSATLGMRLAAIEIRQQDGRRMDLGSAFLHTLGYTVSLSVPILQIISIVLMMTTAYGQGLTDHVMGTTALNRRR